MRRFNAALFVVLAGLASSGCHQPYIMTELDYSQFNQVQGDADPDDYADLDVSEDPRTVYAPDRSEKWEASLEDVKRVALENNRQIALLSYQPGEAGTQIDTALSAFDTTFELGAGWARRERQVSTNIETFGTGQTAVTQDLFGQSVGLGGFGVNSTNGGATQDFFSSSPGQNVMSFAKRNATGGRTQISYSLDYTNTNPVSQFVAVNPAWRSVVNLSVEQPLLQGAGTEFNRSPILIARARHEQSIKDFQGNVHTLLRDLETAYWQLYFSYQDLFSREVGMKQALATWQKEKNRQIADVAAIPDVKQAREQYEFFRAAKIQATARVHEAERNLRELMGLEPDDQVRLIPKDEPTIAEYEPSWPAGVMESMQLRPELSAQRFAVRAAELELFRQKNGLLPDFSFFGSYGISGLDNQFDQSIDRLTDDLFNDWVLGFRLRRPMGERAAHAAVRRARLALSRERKTLRNLELTIRHDVHEAYQNIVTNYALIQAQKDRRSAAAEQLKARLEEYKVGARGVTVDVLLQAQTTLADALRDESLAIVQYNQALIQWEFVRGTILNNDNVAIAEEEISRTNPRLLRERMLQMQRSWVLPIHQSDRLSDELQNDPEVPTPSITLPLKGLESALEEVVPATPPKSDAPSISTPKSSTSSASKPATSWRPSNTPAIPRRARSVATPSESGLQPIEVLPLSTWSSAKEPVKSISTGKPAPKASGMPSSSR